MKASHIPAGSSLSSSLLSFDGSEWPSWGIVYAASLFVLSTTSIIKVSGVLSWSVMGTPSLRHGVVFSFYDNGN